jgi:formate-dependent nitrite reductase membrane component NrfD
MLTVLLTSQSAVRWSTAGEAAGYLSGVCGLALATYTGVLVANTAVPVWQASRRVLPILFGASAMTSVGSAFELTNQTAEESGITTLFGTLGRVAELGASVVMEMQASQVPRVGRPLKHGLSGAMWKTATALTMSSLVVGLLPGRSRGKRVASGILGTLGSMLMRFAVEHAGTVSSRDARSSFHQQRAETF